MKRSSGFRVGGFLLAVPLLLLSDQIVQAEDRLAIVGEQRVLCKQAGRYIGWPSIALTSGGDLLVVFSGDRDSHVSPDGKTQMVRSRDGGKTWGEAVTIHDFPIDDRDAGILRTRNGTLIVSWFTGPPYDTERQGHYVIRSPDGGRSWSEPIRTTATTPHGPIQLEDGRLLFIGQSPHCSHAKPKDYNGSPRGSPYSIAVEESHDDGRSWQPVTTFPVPEGSKMLSFDEPHVVEAQDGKLVLLFRDCNKPNKLWQSDSTDGGKSWEPSAPHACSGLPSPPDPAAQRLAARQLRQALGALRDLCLHQQRRRQDVGRRERDPALEGSQRRPRVSSVRSARGRIPVDGLLPDRQVRGDTLSNGNALAAWGYGWEEW